MNRADTLLIRHQRFLPRIQRFVVLAESADIHKVTNRSQLPLWILAVESLSDLNDQILSHTVYIH